MPRYIIFRRILGFIILLAIAATAVVVIRYFIDNTRKERKNLQKSVSAEISMKTLHFTENQESLKKWELFAQSGTHDKPAEKTSLEDIRFIVERDEKSGPVTVTSKNGVYLHLPKSVELSGNVLAKTKDGMTFETTEITYNSSKQTFSTKERVKLTDAALIVEGIGMDLFVDKQQAIVKKQVEATIYPGKGLK
ncbi:MAG: LPS export ABC transporter periplasmic protein LptC [Geobacteraceae bacterium]|nr:LPS export ABC transporter periplasmic protein LptC [Geobacteraceae bacterium]